MKKYRFKIVTSNMDYIEVEAETPEQGRDLAMEIGRKLHPRKAEKSGPQSSSTQPFLNGGDYLFKENDKDTHE